MEVVVGVMHDAGVEALAGAVFGSDHVAAFPNSWTVKLSTTTVTYNAGTGEFTGLTEPDVGTGYQALTVANTDAEFEETARGRRNVNKWEWNEATVGYTVRAVCVCDGATIVAVADLSGVVIGVAEKPVVAVGAFTFTGPAS